MEKNCSKCGEAFVCGCESRGCWCEGVSLEKEVLQTLKECFDDCLCEGCLRDVEVKGKVKDDGK